MTNRPSRVLRPPGSGTIAQRGDRWHVLLPLDTFGRRRYLGSFRTREAAELELDAAMRSPDAPVRRRRGRHGGGSVVFTGRSWAFRLGPDETGRRPYRGRFATREDAERAVRQEVKRRRRRQERQAAERSAS